MTVRMDEELTHGLKTLAEFIGVYCARKHADTPRCAIVLKTHDVEAIVGSPVELCAECSKLLAHAFTKRSTCPLEPKPACKHCPDHCYHPAYRARIQQVMRYSGTRLLLSGRLDYLRKMLF